MTTLPPIKQQQQQPQQQQKQSILKTARFPRTYFVQETNGWAMVKSSMDKRGWQQLPSDHGDNTRFGLKWVEVHAKINYKTHSDGQMVNHIINNAVISAKNRLTQALKEYYYKGRPQKVSIPWMPDTYDLDRPSDCEELIKAEEMLTGTTDSSGTAAGSDSGGLWIYKPAYANRGRGISVVKGLSELREIVYGTGSIEPTPPSSPRPSPSPSPSPSPTPSPSRKPRSIIPPPVVKHKGIVQRYLKEPLLVNKKKFDLRCYM